ncbi:MAG: hypothetical protein JW881_18845 [Spirochaetales bacterium]|nr:hypothetical protein [Spirochaetales bacterium]
MDNTFDDFDRQIEMFPEEYKYRLYKAMLTITEITGTPQDSLSSLILPYLKQTTAMLELSSFVGK